MTRALRRGHGFFASICVATVFVAFPTTAVAADPAEEELAEKYAPVVRLVEQEEDCGSGEPYDPIEVDLILGNDEVAFRGPWDTTNLVAVGPTADLLATGRDGYHLDFRGDPLDAGCDSQHEGAERAVWGEKKLEVAGGTHPVVYPAAGSHANYYEPALFLGRSAADHLV